MCLLAWQQTRWLQVAHNRKTKRKKDQAANTAQFEPPTTDHTTTEVRRETLRCCRYSLRSLTRGIRVASGQLRQPTSTTARCVLHFRRTFLQAQNISYQTTCWLGNSSCLVLSCAQSTNRTPKRLGGTNHSVRTHDLTSHIAAKSKKKSPWSHRYNPPCRARRAHRTHACYR